MKEQSVERVVLPWGMSLDNPEIVFGTPDPEKGPDSFLSATVKVDYVRPNKNVTFVNYSLSIDDGEHGERFSEGTITGKKRDDTLHFDQQLKHERAENLLESTARHKIEEYDHFIRRYEADFASDRRASKVAGSIALGSVLAAVGNYAESKVFGSTTSSDSDGLIYLFGAIIGFGASVISMTQFLNSKDSIRQGKETANKRDRLVRFVRGIERHGLVRIPNEEA